MFMFLNLHIYLHQKYSCEHSVHKFFLNLSTFFCAQLFAFLHIGTYTTTATNNK